MGACCCKLKAEEDEAGSLANSTNFSVNEVEALYELFSSVSNSIIKDGLIHKEEFRVAVFGTNRKNVFADRVFELFDEKANGVIEFGEFVRALSVFHPLAPVQDKTEFAFRVYDLGNTGFIERSEIRAMLEAVIRENPDLKLPEEALEEVLEKTFREVDLAGDGHISFVEWKQLVEKNPSVINNMTLPALGNLTLSYPSFIFKTQNDGNETSVSPGLSTRV